jgi:hypothetical protein
MFIEQFEEEELSLIDRLLNETYAAQGRITWLLRAVYSSDAAKMELNNAAQAMFRYIDECNKAIAALRIASEDKLFESLPSHKPRR